MLGFMTMDEHDNRLNRFQNFLRACLFQVIHASDGLVPATNSYLSACRKTQDI